MEFKNFLRGDMHRCAAACTENKAYTSTMSKECIEDCSIKLNWAQAYLHTEIEELQNKFQGCISRCNDKINTKISEYPSQEEVVKLNIVFQACVEGCVDQQIEYLPSWLSKIKRAVRKNA